MGREPRKSIQHRRAALAKHAKYGPAATSAAREKVWENFERQVDPEGKLSPADRIRRAEQARHARMLELAERSAAKRRANRKAAEG